MAGMQLSSESRPAPSSPAGSVGPCCAVTLARSSRRLLLVLFLLASRMAYRQQRWPTAADDGDGGDESTKRKRERVTAGARMEGGRIEGPVFIACSHETENNLKTATVLKEETTRKVEKSGNRRAKPGKHGENGGRLNKCDVPQGKQKRKT
uniref:Uncharacterized protein n=1 Tax=Triticum urartu TaxID=4572 RepID=A0A8R7QZC0_TRIUA